MANRHRGEVNIELDKTRTLKFTTRALAELEDKLEIPLSQLGEQTMGIKALIKMCWAGLLHDDSNLTIDEVSDLMDYSDFETLSEKIREALELAFGKNIAQTKVAAVKSGKK